MSIKRSLTAVAIAVPLLSATSGQSASSFSAGDFVEGGISLLVSKRCEMSLTLSPLRGARGSESDLILLWRELQGGS